MLNLEELKPKIAGIAEKKKLSLVILYGSQASGKARSDSDIDIAALGNRPLRFEDITDLINDFSEAFNSNEIDVKSLHFADPLFRFQVMRDGILLFGDRKKFISFKAYAFRDYCDSKDLFVLRDLLIKKRMRNFKTAPQNDR